MKYPENKKYQDSHQEPKQNLTRSLKFRILDDPSKNSLGMNRIKTRDVSIKYGVGNCINK